MDAIFGALSVLALILVIYGPWQKACSDWARQTIFTQRDELFDLASNGHISFDSELYRSIRRMLEINIRFAHELTLPRLIYFAIRSSTKRNPSGVKNVMKQINDIGDEGLKTEIKEIIENSHKAIVYMTIAKSPLTILFLPFAVYPFIVYRLNKNLYNAGVGLLSKLTSVIQSEIEGSNFSGARSQRLNHNVVAE
jgi:hypothetical protein